MTRALSRQSTPPSGPMKIVYVSESPFSTEHVTVVSPNALADLLEAGWVIRKRERRKLLHPTNHSKVPVDYIELGKVVEAQERSVRRREPEDYGTSESRELSTDFSRSISHANSFLGGGSDFAGLPGVQMHSSRFTENAFGAGVDAAKLGNGLEACPFPETAARLREEWQRGWHAGTADTNGGTSPNDKISGAEAFALGQRASKGPPDLEVTCPYPPGSHLYKEWIRGFSDGGGEVKVDDPQ